MVPPLDTAVDDTAPGDTGGGDSAAEDSGGCGDTGTVPIEYRVAFKRWEYEAGVGTGLALVPSRDAAVFSYESLTNEGTRDELPYATLVGYTLESQSPTFVVTTEVGLSESAHRGGHLEGLTAVALSVGSDERDDTTRETTVRARDPLTGDELFSVAEPGEWVTSPHGVEGRLAVGMPDYDGDRGLVALYAAPFGGHADLAGADVVHHGLKDGDAVGYWYQPVGDLDGDGLDDVAFYADRLYVVDGLDFLRDEGIQNALAVTAVNQGGAVGLGDVTGDGLADLATSSWHNGSRRHVLPGGPVLGAPVATLFDGRTAPDWITLTELGDLFGTGRSAIGALTDGRGAYGDEFFLVDGPLCGAVDVSEAGWRAFGSEDRLEAYTPYDWSNGVLALRHMTGGREFIGSWMIYDWR